MIEVENSQRNKKAAKVLYVGRPRTRPPGEDMVLSFRVTEETLTTLDRLADKMTAERPAGSSRVTRTEAVKILLSDAIAARTGTPRA